MTHTHIREVLDAEAGAKELLATAKRDADVLVSDAKKEALTIISGEEHATRTDRERRIAALMVQLEKERGERQALLQARAKAILEKAQKRSDPAIDVIMAKLRN